MRIVFFLCEWKENNLDGHMECKNYYRNFHTTADNSIEPFKVIEELGKGEYNTGIFKLQDGRYVLYYITRDNYIKHCNYSISRSFKWFVEEICFTSKSKRQRGTIRWRKLVS